MNSEEIVAALKNPSIALIDVFHDAVGAMPVGGRDNKTRIVCVGLAAMVRYLETGERPEPATAWHVSAAVPEPPCWLYRLWRRMWS